VNIISVPGVRFSASAAGRKARRVRNSIGIGASVTGVSEGQAGWSELHVCLEGAGLICKDGQNLCVKQSVITANLIPLCGAQVFKIGDGP
jgi:hypothetical protein